MAVPFHEYYHVATDDTLRETISHGNARYPFAYYLEDVWQFDFHRIDWHWHHEVEFVTVEKGQLLCLIGEEKIKVSEGCGIFVNSGILHRYEAVDGNVLTPNIVFSPVLLAAEGSLIYEKYVLPLIMSAVPYLIFDPQIEWQNDILEILSAVYSLQENDESDDMCEKDKGNDLQDGSVKNTIGNELRTMRLLMKMWEIMFEHWDISFAGNGICRTDHRQAKLRLMMQYIHDHYAEQISLEEIASAASVSKSSALNIFQAGIHISPVSYLIQYRLQCASSLLYTTEKSVSDIAEETGFSSAGYFCRKFKEHYHVSPNAYKKRRREDELRREI